MVTVLFAGRSNAGRSQMAAAFFNSMADPARARAMSGGTAPAASMQPEVVISMRAIGFDLSGYTPRLLTPELCASAQLVVTIEHGEECPEIQGIERQDWSVPDPEKQPVELIDAIRDEIRARVACLISERAWARANTEPS